MADSKISDLAVVTDVQAADAFVLARAGTSKKITGASLASELGGGGSLPAWWTVDSTPGAESVDFGGRVSISPTDTELNELAAVVSPVGFIDDSNFATLLSLRTSVQDPDAGEAVHRFHLAGYAMLAAAGEGSGTFRFEAEDAPGDQLQMSQDAVSISAAQPTLVLHRTGPPGQDLFAVNDLGVVIGITAAPADGVIGIEECNLWFDTTDGAAKLRMKGRSADGTLVSGEVALT